MQHVARLRVASEMLIELVTCGLKMYLFKVYQNTVVAICI
jgi:hypothetical protein